MSKPDDIPQDVWGAARIVTDHHDGSPTILEAIARAILAERRECAKRYRDGASPETWDYFRSAEDAINPNT